ncbi:MAG TPA: TolC family protein [Planctomycetaceae bacterium]
MAGGQIFIQRAAAGLAAACLAAGCAAPRPAATATLPGAAAARARIDRTEAALPKAKQSSAKTAKADSAPGKIRLAAHENADDERQPGAMADKEQLVAADGTNGTDATLPVDVSLTKSHPINLGTALQLTSGQNPQVAYARERIQEAFAQLERAQVLWLPSLRAGVTYDKHEGPAQQVDGNMINVSRSALFGGFGGVMPGAATPAIPGLFANFQIVDAVFQPRIAQLTAAARKSAAEATTNDALLAAALAHLELLRAGQDLAIARGAARHTQDLVDVTDNYAKTGKGTEADHDRALAELAARKDDVETNVEAVRVASARLAQQLNLDPRLSLEPQEPTVFAITLVDVETSEAELVARGLTNRPEVCENRQLVAEAVERLKREEYAPLIPSVLLGIGYGGFGGGTGGNLTNFNNSFDSVAGAFWEVRNLGFGERAIRCEARSRIQQAQWKEVTMLDQVAREVVEAHAQVQSRKVKIPIAEEGLKSASASFERNMERIQNVQGLPIEALQSIQALTAARRQYLRAVIAYNEAQFRLHRALGWPSDPP